MPIDFGLSEEEFSSEYQEKKPFLFKNAVNPSCFSWNDVNDVLSRSNIASEDFKLSFDGIVPKHEYIETYMDVGMVRHHLIKPVIYDYLKRGATLIDNKVVNEPKFDVFARQIARFTGRQVVTSSYTAFGEKSSFRNHWDTRDVFVVQLIGRKRWIVYGPSLESPLYVQQSKDYEKDYPCPEEVYMDVILEAGDVFYLPRGWWHNPLPLGEETFHLAIGTFPPFAIDYINWMCGQMPAFVGARKSLDSWDQDKELISELGRQINEFINHPENYRRFMDDFFAAQRVRSKPALELFGSPHHETLPDHLGIYLNANRIEGIPDTYAIVNGVKLNLGEASAKVLRLIENKPGITPMELVNALPEENAGQIRALLYELGRQDVLELAVH